MDSMIQDRPIKQVTVLNELLILLILEECAEASKANYFFHIST